MVEVRYLSAEELCEMFHLPFLPASVMISLFKAHVPRRDRGDAITFRTVDAAQFLGVRDFCAVCGTKVLGAKEVGPVSFCGKPCRRAAVSALESAAGSVNLGAPPITVSLSGDLLARICRVAKETGMGMPVAVRYLLVAGVRQVEKELGA